jgi:hypothetical protein
MKSIVKNILMMAGYALAYYLGNLLLKMLRNELADRKLQHLGRLIASQKVDETSEESFPASDAPAWNGSGTTVGSVH